MKLAPYQRELITTGRDFGMLLMLWRRQGRKTTTFAWQGLRWMLENPGCLVTFATCSIALGSELSEREVQMLMAIVNTIREESNPDVVKVECEAEALPWYDIADLYTKNRLEVTLHHDRTTRSRTKIIAANYATARGYSGYVMLDEIGFIRDFKLFFEAVEPIFSANPAYRLWMATTPPEDDNHFSYELSAYPPGKEFIPNERGNWYENETGIPVHRVAAEDAEEADVHLYDSKTRQIVTPEQHRAKALDKVAWDRNYGLIFTQGGVSAIGLIALHQAQKRGSELGCIFAEDELPANWTAVLDPEAETGVGADPATTEKEKSNPFSVSVVQEKGGGYTVPLIFRFRSSDPVKCRAILKEICLGCSPRALAIDATSERFWAAETKTELEPITHVELVVNSERIVYLDESMTYKSYLGNLLVNAIDDRNMALPPAKEVRTDFRLVRRFRGGFDNMLDNSGNHADTFDSTKNGLHALLIDLDDCDAEAVPTRETFSSSVSRGKDYMPDSPNEITEQGGLLA